MRVNLKDTTFILPVRIDSIIRLENLLLTLDNLESNFDTNIIIIEAAHYHNQIVKSLIKEGIKYIFTKTNLPFFTEPSI